MAEAPIEAEVGNDVLLPEGLAPPEAAPEPEIEQTAPPQAGGPPVVLHDRYYIDPGAPCPNWILFRPRLMRLKTAAT
jgi:hypothetical protein